jgi:hypothetical protein
MSADIDYDSLPQTVDISFKPDSNIIDVKLCMPEFHLI